MVKKFILIIGLQFINLKNPGLIDRWQKYVVTSIDESAIRNWCLHNYTTKSLYSKRLLDEYIDIVTPSP